jgi:hypothetical protein
LHKCSVRRPSRPLKSCKYKTQTLSQHTFNELLGLLLGFTNEQTQCIDSWHKHQFLFCVLKTACCRQIYNFQNFCELLYLFSGLPSIQM